jgi:hypothetical protein
MFGGWQFGWGVISSLLTMIGLFFGGSVHASDVADVGSSQQVPVARAAVLTSHPGPVRASAHPSHPAAARRVTPRAHRPALGVYAGPGAKGVVGAAAFGTLSGSAPSAVLDFASSRDWAGITGPNWLLDPRVDSHARLEYSLPMFPGGDRYSLAACAAGAYDAQWQRTGRSLVEHRLADTIVRPGWEFNGSWYPWSAKGHLADYVGCFRRIVTTMRAVTGQHFAFDWNPNLGAGAFPAELAYPGDSYVDYVGVDVYDTSWSHYPSAHPAQARAAAWRDDLDGDHGLAFWSRFAAAHHKPMALPEWGVTWLSNGHGGGDDPAFVDHMFGFMTDPANNVAYGHYFDWTSSAGDHKLTGSTRFPASAAEYGRRARLLAG